MKMLFSSIIVVLMLSACAPSIVSTPIPSVVIPVISSPTATYVLPTETPLPQVPQIKVKDSQGNVISVPDLKDPSYASLLNSSSSQFINAMQEAGITIDQSLLLSQLENPQNFKVINVDEKKYIFSTFTTTDQKMFPVLVAEQKENGEWTWQDRSINADLFQANGVLFGFTYRMKDNPYRKSVRAPDDLVAASSHIVTPEDNFYQPFIFNPTPPKWEVIQEYLDFINKYDLVSGAPHLYYAGNESTSQDKQELISITQQIIARCKGTINFWDINELFNENGSLRDPNALENAKAVIKTIRDNDANATIIINDWGMDWQPLKDKALYEFVKQLLADGLIKQGDIIGYQGHNGVGDNSTPEQFADWFDKYAKLGLNLRITEADIADVKSISQSNETKKAELILMYYRAGKILEGKYHRKILDAIIMWGSTNNSSWYIDEGISGEYPLLLDNEGNPYLSWYLIAQQLFQDAEAK